MTEDELKRRVLAALEEFRRVDRHLLECDLSERCIAARVAFYLQNGLHDYPEFSVDVEYNRKGIRKKRMALREECFDKRDENGESLVVPDVIVHRRGDEGPNILVLEFKKTTNPVGYGCDRLRLQAFKDQLQYGLGGLVECETRQSREPNISVVEWI